MVKYTYTRLPVPATHPTSHRTTLGNLIFRRPKAFLLLLLTTVVGGAFWASVNEDYQALISIKEAPPDWETLYRSTQRGWTTLSSSDPYLAPPPQPLAIDSFSPECLDDWGAKGVLCPELHGEFKGYAVDVLYSYVNGTDELMRSWREGAAANIRSGRAQALEKRQGGRRVGPAARVRKVGPSLDKKARHFRDHDELRFSIRSLVSAFLPSSITKIILLTADVPLYSLPLAPSHSPPPNSTLVFSPGTTRIGQIPQWLDQNALENGRKKPELKMAYQSEAFDVGKGGGGKSVTGVVPSFSSLAIESRMVNVPGLGEHVFYLNDDCFIMNPLAATDVASPLFGPVFRLQRDLSVIGVAPQDENRDLDGEWPGLGHANWLLDQRFGTRKRSYLAHIAKTFSTPLLKEAQALWAEEFEQTSQSRFRGMAPEFQTLFLSTHYIIERHREALLWSFFVARSDQNRDGFLSLAERYSMLSELGFNMDETKSSSAEIVVPFPHRESLSALDKIRQEAGLEKPKETQIEFDSRDGYASFSTQLPRFYDRTNQPLPFPVVHLSSAGGKKPEMREACAFTIKGCLGSAFLSDKKELKTVDVFRKVAFEEVHCGDCAILALLGKSGPVGLAAFLPPTESIDEDDTLPLASSISPLGGRATTHERFTHLPSDLAGNLRHKSLVLIQRYAYTIGTSSSRLLTLTTQGLAISTFSSLNKELAALYYRKEPPPPATFVTINDNTMSDKGSELVDFVLAKFFDFQWPKKSIYEMDN